MYISKLIHKQGKPQISNNDFKASLKIFCDYSTSRALCNNGRDMNHIFKQGDCTIPGFESEFEDLDAAW